jgi:hypothetical protein
LLVWLVRLAGPNRKLLVRLVRSAASNRKFYVHLITDPQVVGPSAPGWTRTLRLDT